jgi:hypothetical protein
VIDIESTTSERLIIPVTTTEDPTAAVPEFQLTTGDRGDPTGTWEPGTWGSAWDPDNGRIDAESPTVGAAGVLVIAQGERYDLWIRWTVTGESPVKRVATLNVR